MIQSLAGKHIVLGLTGGIACYKSAYLCRRLIEQGATVQVVMTDAASQFITPVTLQALSGRTVYTNQWDARRPNNMPHIDLSREADAIVIAPCSADFISKLAVGAADDLLSLLCLARPMQTCPLIVAPAMNLQMWQHPATQRNLKQIAADGTTVLSVGQGDQACGETGDGRMLEPDEIVQDLITFFAPKSLVGKHVLITAGPTYEAIDPVRGITNISSGKMGYAIAQAAHEAGAVVTLVSGPTALPTPRGVTRVNVQGARDMLTAVQQQVSNCQLFISVAAVADWRVANASDQKLKKVAGGLPQLQFEQNPDILATVAALPTPPYCVGFAAESENLHQYAQEKRLKKNVPLLVGNLAQTAMGADDNELVLFDAQGTTMLERAPKLVAARQLIEAIAARLR